MGGGDRLRQGGLGWLYPPVINLTALTCGVAPLRVHMPCQSLDDQCFAWNVYREELGVEMKHFSRRWMLATFVATFGATAANAQDQCGDVLRNGAFDSVDIASRSEYQEIIVSRFLSSNYASSRRSDSGIGGKSIGEMVMGNAYTESEYEQKKNVLRQSYSRTLTQTEEWSLATRTANPDIVRAWEACMGNRSGLIARFETQPGDGANLTLILTVNGAMGVNQVTVAGDTTIPADTQILSQVQYDRCLRNGAIITATAPCRVALRSPSNSPLKVIVSTAQGDAEAYVGKRLRWVTSRRPFRSTINYTQSPNSSSWQSGLVTMSDDDVEAGYSFVPGSLRVTGPTQTYGSGDGRCNQYTQTVTSTDITYRYWVRATDNTSTICRLIFVADMEKGEFVADE
jgi:hypothetical protein